MNSKEYLEEIKGYFVKVVSEVKVNTACDHYDINKVAENFYLPILKHVYSCPDLKNLNIIKDNFPAIDLGCNSSRVSFQVTSSRESDKVAKTLELFKKYNLDKDFDRVILLIITEKQNSYTSRKIFEAAKGLNFKTDSDIIDYTDILEEIKDKDVEYLAGLLDILRKEYVKNDKFRQCRENLNQILALSKSKIDLEKSSKKYIPEIFGEASQAKDKARLFINPSFFYRRSISKLNKIDETNLNNSLRMLSAEPVHTVTIKDFNGEENYQEQISHIESTKDVLTAYKAEIGKYNKVYGDGKGFGFTYPDEKQQLLKILDLTLSGEAYGIQRTLDEILNELEICLARVFLVTGKAGQGKTNFVCNLSERLCSSFDMPQIYIPAREINQIKDFDIFNYIINNRYLVTIQVVL